MQKDGSKIKETAWAKPTLRLVRGVVLTAVLCAVCGCAGEQQVLCAKEWGEYVGDGTGVWVSVGRQEVRVVEGRRVVKVYRCSTARAGVGCVKDSGQTPDGWHRVGAKIGDGLPAGAVLKERQWTGDVWKNPKGEVRNSKEAERTEIIPPPPFGGLPLVKGESIANDYFRMNNDELRMGGAHPTGSLQGESYTGGDLILSRILWLEGMEDGINRGGDVDTRQRYIYIHGTNRVDDLGQPASAGCVRMDPDEVIELFDAVEEGCLVLITRDETTDCTDDTDYIKN